MPNPKKCAILSMDSLENFECYDYLVEKPLADLGWHTDTISWRANNIDWNQYQAVIIRSPWDYQDDAEAFLRKLDEIEQSDALLFNSLKMVRWNIDKRYLAELEKAGVMIVPTLWQEAFDATPIKNAYRHFKCDEIVIKPCVSANADNTWRLSKEKLTQAMPELEGVFAQRAFMIQPFIQSVVETGERSLFYFNGEYSHAILKTPAKGDFRVQEEHGGVLSTIEPNEALKNAGSRAMEALFEVPLYARLDFVNVEGEYAMMEAELIEPSLYFNMDETAPERFALAFDKRMANFASNN